MPGQTFLEQGVRIPAGSAMLDGILTLPDTPRGLVLFTHGSGSSRFSPRNKSVAAVLHDAGFGTLLFDLLTVTEGNLDEQTREHRFNIALLADRLVQATDWLGSRGDTALLRVGYFGASTGAAAALVAAAERPDVVGAIVSRGGRPDLAGDALPKVHAPTLLIVGGADEAVIEMNQEAMELMRAEVELSIVPNATHLFEEPGALAEVSRQAQEWFARHLTPRPASSV